MLDNQFMRIIFELATWLLPSVLRCGSRADCFVALRFTQTCLHATLGRYWAGDEYPLDARPALSILTPYIPTALDCAESDEHCEPDPTTGEAGLEKQGLQRSAPVIISTEQQTFPHSIPSTCTQPLSYNDALCKPALFDKVPP